MESLRRRRRRIVLAIAVALGVLWVLGWRWQEHVCQVTCIAAGACPIGSGSAAICRTAVLDWPLALLIAPVSGVGIYLVAGRVTARLLARRQPDRAPR